ncbi:unnamed protein product [Urochloa humidicola]
MAATVASRLLRAARNASLASRTAAAAASRAAAVASRSARVAARAARSGSCATSPLKSCPTCGHASSTMLHASSAGIAIEYFSSDDDYDDVPDDAKTPTDKDIESDEAVWALYERWCKGFNKERDHAEMARRFKIFRHYAGIVHEWNTYIPEDPKEAAIHRKKREKAKLLLSKGKDVSNFEERHLPMELAQFADGGDPLDECSKRLLKEIEEREQVRDVEDDVRAE